MLPGGLAETQPASESLELARKRQEMAARDAQADDYDRMRILALYGKFLEIPAALARLKPGPEHVVLEAGCGTGRMTPRFASRCRSLIALDFSLESLRACQRKLETAGLTNVDLIQGDVCALPFAGSRFDKVVSCGVLEHVPTPESRAQMISELARVARVGSDIVLTVYEYNLFARLFGQKEGAHSGGIYFYRYSHQELRQALGRSLVVRRIHGLLYYCVAHCRKPPGAGPSPEKPESAGRRQSRRQERRPTHSV